MEKIILTRTVLTEISDSDRELFRKVLVLIERNTNTNGVNEQHEEEEKEIVGIDEGNSFPGFILFHFILFIHIILHLKFFFI